jgi:26S proteasome regulatory subunit N6
MTKGQTEELLTRIEAKNCDEESLKAREKAIYELAEVYLAEGLPRKVMEFVEQRKECLESFSKPKAAKILRVLIEKLEKVPGSEPLQIEMCKNLIQWCEA